MAPDEQQRQMERLLADARVDLEAERARVLEAATAIAEEWLLEADDEWAAIVDRAARDGEVAAAAAADAARERIIAAAELEADRLIDEAKARVERMQQDADERITAEMEVILAAAGEEAESTVAAARREAADIVRQAELDADALRDRVEGELAPARERLAVARAELAQLFERSRRFGDDASHSTAALPHVSPPPSAAHDIALQPAVRVLSVERERTIDVDEIEAPVDLTDGIGSAIGHAPRPRRRVLARLFGR